MSMARNQSLYEWWTTDKNGRDEKFKIMDKMDFETVDMWINNNKDSLDFTNRNNNNN